MLEQNTQPSLLQSFVWGKYLFKNHTLTIAFGCSSSFLHSSFQELIFGHWQSCGSLQTSFYLFFLELHLMSKNYLYFQKIPNIKWIYFSLAKPKEGKHLCLVVKVDVLQMIYGPVCPRSWVEPWCCLKLPCPPKIVTLINASHKSGQTSFE